MTTEQLNELAYDAKMQLIQDKGLQGEDAILYGIDKAAGLYQAGFRKALELAKAALLKQGGPVGTLSAALLDLEFCQQV